MKYSSIPRRPNYLLDDREVDGICDVGDEGRRIIDDTGFESQSSFNHRRGRRIANILNDMFEPDHFQGKKIIELGPGHYAFALLARHLGAEVVCIERDPSFVRLGRYLGFEVVDADFFSLSASKFDKPFDGLFVKGTFNACVPRKDEELSEFVATLTKMLAEDGWGWFVTVNKANKAPDGQSVEGFIKHRVGIQKEAFRANGWSAWAMMSDEDRRQYALNYANSLYLYTRNLRISGGEAV